MGSLNGTPISITSATDATACRLLANASLVGNPAVRYATSAGLPLLRALRSAVLIVSRGVIIFFLSESFAARWACLYRRDPTCQARFFCRDFAAPSAAHRRA